MWEAGLDGRELKFQLEGINNQNFIMRDEETGTWWQQVSGEAIFGPLKGRRLKQVVHDELAFSTWKREQPRGRVLRPDERFADKYAPRDWEERMLDTPTPTAAGKDDPLEPRALVVGIALNNESKAYPFSDLQHQGLILDEIGGVSVMMVMGDDRKSVRAFERTVDDRVLEFFAKPDSSPLVMVDSETGSEWDFTGKATSGPMAGRALKKIAALNDYWFDWKEYHPDTQVYSSDLLMK